MPPPTSSLSLLSTEGPCQVACWTTAAAHLQRDMQHTVSCGVLPTSAAILRKNMCYRHVTSPASCRKPRAILGSPAQQSGAFAEVIASLASDSPPPQQQQRPAQQRPRQRLPAPSQARPF